MSDTPTTPENGRNSKVVTPARIAAAVCVIVPFAAMFWVASYNRTGPSLGGFPFFYWYQLVWVVITALLMGAAYWLIRYDERGRR
jgi:hypothetical protein